MCWELHHAALCIYLDWIRFIYLSGFDLLMNLYLLTNIMSVCLGVVFVFIFSWCCICICPSLILQLCIAATVGVSILENTFLKALIYAALLTTLGFVLENIFVFVFWSLDVFVSVFQTCFLLLFHFVHQPAVKCVRSYNLCSRLPTLVIVLV